MTERLFLPNNHSKYHIGWQAIPDKERKEILKLVSSHYKFDDIAESKIFQVREWERMSNNFRVRIRFGRKWSDVLFRRHIQIKDKKSLFVLDRIFEFLSKKEIPTPHIIQTKDSKTSFSHGNYFYVMYQFIPGDHYRGTLREFKEIARQIAFLHQALKKIPFLKEISQKPLLLAPWNMAGWQRLFADARSKKGKIDLIFNHYRDFILQQAGIVKESLDNMSKAKIQPIHCDLHPQNTIFKKEKLVAFLDFEGVRLGELCRDVANACHRFLRQFIVFQKKDWRRALPRGLEIFIREYTEVNPLKKNEISLFPVFISDELLRKIFKDLNLYYFRNYSRNVERGELEKKLNLLKEATIIKRYLI